MKMMKFICCIFIICLMATDIFATPIASWTFPEGVIGNVFTNSPDQYAGLLLKKVYKPGQEITYVKGIGCGIQLANTGTYNNDGSFCIVDDNPRLTGHNDGYTGFRSMAISGYVKLFTVKLCQIVGKWDYSTGSMNGYRLYINSIGEMCFEMTGTEGNFSIKTHQQLTTNVWYRFEANWEEDYGAYNVQILLNGVVTRSTRYIGTLLNTTFPLAVGGLYRSSTDSGQYVDGQLDNIIISTDRTDLLQVSGVVDPTPIVPTGAHLTNQPGFFKSGFVHDPPFTPSGHASTQVQTSDGRIRAAWMAGTCEGHADGVILKADQYNNYWWDAPDVVGDGSTSELPISSAWNPVLFQRPGGALYCYYKDGMLGSPGGISGLYKTSTTGGHTWSEPVRMSAIGPSKNKPLLLSSGTLIMPGDSTMYLTTDYGLTLTSKTAPNPSGYSILQATVVRVGGSDYNLLALFRTANGKIAQSRSYDLGNTWSAVTLTSLPNNHSGIDAANLSDGRIVLVYNHISGTTTGTARTPLNIAVSSDGGVTWYAAIVLEDEPGEFSYPSIICDSSGMVHVMYTWNRLRMKWAILDPSQFVLTQIVNGVWPN